ncbi:type II toxin-antitoxin system PemK/MazF family toxin [Micromonospora chalcea]|uniref:type II toxin-antitoxin system PemK/MazF family toxin n=1 Tax=Micromonospora chalcea TaxID=1874 RepID=UPI0033D638E6
MPYPSEPPRRGEVYWFDFDPARGSEQAGERPAVVISLDSFNQRMPVVIIAALSTKVRLGSRVSVHLPAGQPLPKEGSVLAFQVMTADKSRLKDFAGRLSKSQLQQLDDALRLSFGL